MPTEPTIDPTSGPGAALSEPPTMVLQRWQDHGAAWRVVSTAPPGSSGSPGSWEVTVALLRCDGGEEVQRLTSSDPDLRTWLAGRTSSEQ